MVYSTRRFVVCLSVCHFVLVFFSPFSIAITSLGEERAKLSAFRTFVRFVLVWICRFPLPLWVWEGLHFVIVAFPGLFSYVYFALLDVLGRWSRCWSCSLLLCGLFCGGFVLCLALCRFVLVFCGPFGVAIASLGEEGVSRCSVRSFGLCLFEFVGFLFLLVSGKGCGL